MAKTRSRKRIGIRERLGQLTYRGACRLLSDSFDEGEARLRSGGRLRINFPNDVYLGGDTLRVNVMDPHTAGGVAIVTVVEMTSRPKGLQINCDRCDSICVHAAATLGLILEEKDALGISAPPDENEPLEYLTEAELLRRALADREKRAEKEKMKLQSVDTSQPWTDYTITSNQSGKTYRVSLRGFEPGESYCSCPDFRTNQLGTCKHIIHAQTKVRKRFSNEAFEAGLPAQEPLTAFGLWAELGSSL